MPSPTVPLAAPARQVVAGLGCRRGCGLDELSTLLEEALAAQQLSVDNLIGLASIEHKREEAGLLALAERLGLPLTCFSPDELKPFQAHVHGSALTLSSTGSPAIAEPCALALVTRLGNREAHLLGGKTRSANATCALALITRKDTQ